MNKFRYLMKEGFKSIFTHGFMSFASITIIVACLLIMGSFSLLAINIDNMIQDLEDDNQVVAFVDETLSDEDARSIQSYLEALPNVAEVQFVTREEAMESFAEDYPAELFEGIESTVFRHRYVVYMDDISLMAETVTELENVPGIADVNAYLEIAEGFVTVRNVISIISLVLVVILVIISVFIMANTIKLTTFGRREEIAIMKMVGASNAFIRWPFIVEGLVLGLVGAAIAFFAQWGIYVLVCDRVMESIAGNIVTVVPFTALMLPVALVFLGIGLVVGAFGGVIAIRNYLKV